MSFVGPCYVQQILFVPKLFFLSLIQLGSPSREVDRFWENSPKIEAKAREILSRIEEGGGSAQRYSSILLLSSLGDSIVPVLDRTLESANRDKIRAGILVLGRLNTPLSQAALDRFYRVRKDLELECLGLLVREKKIKSPAFEQAWNLVQGKNHERYLRLTAAFALSQFQEMDPSRLSALFLEADYPEIEGTLAIALGQAGLKEILLQKLNQSKDAVLRTGIYLGLASAGYEGKSESLIADLESSEDMLAAAAALSLTDLESSVAQERWHRVYRQASIWTRSAMIEGIARGKSNWSQETLRKLSGMGNDEATRKSLLIAALSRRDPSLFQTLRPNSSEEKFYRDWMLARVSLCLDGVEAWPENENEWTGVLPETIEAGLRKFLQKELDPRSLREQLQQALRSRQLLLRERVDYWQRLYVGILLGSGSRFFENQSGFPAKAFWNKDSKKRELPIDSNSNFYEDLWFCLKLGGH